MSVCALAACSPGPQGGGTGSNTNWLSTCDRDDACPSGLTCICGVCTLPCERSSECGELADAQCADATSSSKAALCAGSTDDIDDEGVCLPRCVPGSCAEGQVCMAGACTPLHPDVDCLQGSSLEISTVQTELQARFGSVFADSLYLPVSYDAQPEDWSEPMTQVPIVATVRSADNALLEGCSLHWGTDAGSGWAYPDGATTTAQGSSEARWVAGDTSEQALTVAMADASGAVQSVRVLGHALAHDAEPQAPEGEPAASTVRPSAVYLSQALSPDADAVRVTVDAITFPHHAYYAAISVTGLYTGLQNTSELDASSSAIPEENRRLLMSAWNVEEGDALLLYRDDAVTCGTHDQDAGGIQCLLSAAWELGESHDLLLEYTGLADQQSVPEYADLGYVTDACASTAGCVDYTLFLSALGSAEPPLRVAAMRYHRGDLPDSFSSFIDAYDGAVSQTSCLLTPRYEVAYGPAQRVGGVFEPIASGDFWASYNTWHNQVCANYSGITRAGRFVLATGGPEGLGRPFFTGDPAATLTLE